MPPHYMSNTRPSNVQPIMWRFSVARLHFGLDQRSCCTLSAVSTEMGDCLRAGKLSHCVTNHPGQLSLAIHPWVGALSTGDGYDHR